MTTHFVHLAKVQTFKILQCQKWRQSESVKPKQKIINVLNKSSLLMPELAMLHWIILILKTTRPSLFILLGWKCWTYINMDTEFDLFLMSASLRPSLGVSTVRAIALNPALSALLTSWATTCLFLYTWKIWPEKS